MNTRDLNTVINQDKAFMRSVLKKELHSVKNTVIYGAGVEGIRTLIELRQTGIEPLCFIDADSNKHGSNIGGVTVYSPDKLNEFNKDTAIFVSPVEQQLSITKNLCNQGYHNLYYRISDLSHADKDRVFTNLLLNEGIKSAKQVLVYGAGKQGQRTLDNLRQFYIEPTCFIDTDIGKQGNIYEGINIYSPDKLNEFSKDTAIIVTPLNSLVKITRQLSNLGFNNLYYRSFTPTLWDEYTSSISDRKRQIDKDRSIIEYVRSNLHDKKSIEIFDAALFAREHADSSRLESFLDSGEYNPSDIPDFKLSDDEVYVNCGAYDGNSIIEFLSATNRKYRYIYAFEPEPVNFALTKAVVNHNRIANVKLFNIGVSDYARDAMFVSAMYGSRISELGNTPVQLDTLDNMLSTESHRPTFISMDLEGAEPEALIGGAGIIKRDRPKLAISIYHYPINQLWDIPYYIMKNYSNYKFYIRQFHTYPDTILYAL
jgi:FkbM family methyltransferase